MAALVKKEPANLLSLNDECLENIFDYLDFPACLKLVEAYVELEPIFQVTLVKGNRKVDSVLVDNFENIVQNYGSHLTNVRVSSNVEFFHTMAEYCVEGRLCELELSSVPITGHDLNTQCKAMLSQLKVLWVFYCEISDENLGRLLAMCPQLETLMVHSNSYNVTLKPFLHLTSINMKTICLINNTKIDRRTLIQLLIRQPNLQKFYCGRTYRTQNSHYDIVSKMLPNLKVLDFSSGDIGHVITLKQLTHIRIEPAIDHLAEVNNYLTMSTGLQSLHIHCETMCDHQFNDLIDAIGTCTSLQTLELRQQGVADGSKSMAKLAETLSSLQILRVHQWNSTSEWQHDFWLEFVEKARKLERLVIYRGDQNGIPNFADFIKKLCDIVRRRDQNDRRLDIYCYVRSYGSLICSIVGSHVFHKNERCRTNL